MKNLTHLQQVLHFKTSSANNLEGMFGLIAPQAPSSPELEFVEFNYADRVSVLKEAVVAEGERKSLIETSWHLVRDEVAGTYRKSCFAKCTISGSNHSKSHSPVHAPS